MRLLSMLFATAMAVTTQTPLTTTFANNNGGAVGGAVYFDLHCIDPQGLTITDIDLNFQGPGGASGSIDIYLMPGGYLPHTAPWVHFRNGVIASSMPVGTPTNVTLAPPLELGPNCTVGVAIVANGLAHAYTNGPTMAANYPTYGTNELLLTTGAASNTPFLNPLFPERVVNANVNYIPGGQCPDFATCIPQGDGCVKAFASFYEVQPPTTMGLSGLTVTGTSTSPGYVVTTAPGIANTIGSLGTATALSLGDDQVAPAGTLGLEVSSNCQVFGGPGGTAGFSPSVAAFLNQPSQVWASWTDLNPLAAGSGLVWYEESGAMAQITYDGVYGWNTMLPNSVQFVIDTATGDFQITYGALSTSNPENWLTGYSPGGASLDPGPADISSGTIITSPADIAPLTLLCDNRPSTGTTWSVTTTNIEPTALLHLGITGLSRPGLPLGAEGLPPGCTLSASVDIVTAIILNPPPTVSWPVLAIPPGNSGFQINVQAITLGGLLFSLATRTSNGLKGTVGDI